MLTRFKGGTVVDPTAVAEAIGRDAGGAVAIAPTGVRRDLYVEDGRIVTPTPGAKVDREIDVGGRILMAGAIDMHTHIGGGKVNIGRLMMPEIQRPDPEAVESALARLPSCGDCAPGTLYTGYRYAEMGYTACFEPAMLPINARQAHLEMGDTPIVDKGAYAMIGSDDFFLRMLVAGRDRRAIADYVGFTLNASKAMAIKVVNPGGISAFKFNQRQLDVDGEHAYYRITPRQVIQALTRALWDLKVPHPLHVHGSNLGVAGNVETTLKTIEAAEGLPIHLTHVQFHSYGNEGEFGFSSGAAKIAEAVNAHRNVSIDVGQIMFGQTVTMSGDSMAQYRGAGHAQPRKTTLMDIECDAGCGIVPFRYRDKSFVHSLQWAIGLELFLLVRDPWRIFLTTDHPNGAPFTTYPHLIRLLMDRSFRNEQFQRLHPQAKAMSQLESLTREYTLEEIAILTRAGPARILGMADRGHLGAGAAADIVVYDPDPDPQVMFARPRAVFKNGVPVVEQGRLVAAPVGDTHVVAPEYDRAIEGEVADYMEKYLGLTLSQFRITESELCECGRGNRMIGHACRLPVDPPSAGMKERS